MINTQLFTGFKHYHRSMTEDLSDRTGINSCTQTGTQKIYITNIPGEECQKYHLCSYLCKREQAGGWNKYKLLTVVSAPAKAGGLTLRTPELAADNAAARRIQAPKTPPPTNRDPGATLPRRKRTGPGSLLAKEQEEQRAQPRWGPQGTPGPDPTPRPHETYAGAQMRGTPPPPGGTRKDTGEQ